MNVRNNAAHIDNYRSAVSYVGKFIKWTAVPVITLKEVATCYQKLTAPVDIEVARL